MGDSTGDLWLIIYELCLWMSDVFMRFYGVEHIFFSLYPPILMFAPIESY
jgi:hypothetical protein